MTISTCQDVQVNGSSGMKSRRRRAMELKKEKVTAVKNVH